MARPKNLIQYLSINLAAKYQGIRKTKYIHVISYMYAQNVLVQKFTTYRFFILVHMKTSATTKAVITELSTEASNNYIAFTVYASLDMINSYAQVGN